jgi:GT2 family glycosyltransferase
MPTHIADLELSTPLPTLTLQSHERGLFALLRWHGRPVGLLRWPQATGTLTPAQVQAAITASAQLPALPSAPAPAPISATAPLSIIICTHERPDDLQRCLTSLLPLHAARHEVLVVDNAPRTERTVTVARQFPFRYLVEPRQGLDHARNCGLHAAQHALVAYIDDDAVADPAWAAALAAPFTNPAVGCTTGLVLPLELATAAQERFELYCTNRRTFQLKRYRAPQTPPAAAGVAGMGANMALRRDLALTLGGFDPRLDAGTATQSGGDTDMFARVLDHGATIVYTPDALVWHRHRRSEAELRHCLFGYGVGLYAFLSKRLLEQRDPQALMIGVRWWGGPIAKAAWAKLRGQPALPLELLAQEAAGAWFGALRLAQEMRRQARTTVVPNTN